MTDLTISLNPTASELLTVVSTIKTAIMRSRYLAAKSVNKHAIALYFHVGEYITRIMESAKWGESAINQISNLLQVELPGLYGFAPSSIRKMRSFYNTWKEDFDICSLLTNKFITSIKSTPDKDLDICSLSTNNLNKSDFEAFMSIGFSHHYEIASKNLDREARLFYIRKCAAEFWSVKTLHRQINDGLHKTSPIKAHSFNKTISDIDLRSRALKAFKDEYLLNLVNLEDNDPDYIDERILEQEIVHNIKSFIMAFGQDFAFMGNQYRLEVDGETLYVDLLFYHRGLRCLVAVELKSGKFKGAYAGQLNVYLSALDDLVKRPDENPSIGLILCKEKSNRMVEYAFRDMNKPMGVATYTITSKLPKQYTNSLPTPEELRELLDTDTFNQ
ncbi:MAG: PDDEXK nuclease domain-containing protein [Paramuribaculum sp.]|nr:PDDEXK nuclease domain-containing protein [Paramuribaculum sp.]